ncbi:MAG: type VI secretion system protein VasG [Myxococcota bacterium]|jgi:type VI secretion system protein VasG
MSNLDLKSLVSLLNGTVNKNLEAAAGLCMNREHYEITVEHLLFALIEDATSDLPYVLRHFELDPGRVKKALNHALDTMKSGNMGKPVFSPIVVSLFERAWLLSSVNYSLGKVRSGTLLLAILENPQRYGSGLHMDLLQVIQKHTLEDDLLNIVAGSGERDIPQSAGAAGGTAPDSVSAVMPGGALDRYATNFTQRAREGHIDPVFGRDREIRQMVDILARRRKNNPIIVGEAGVGKTALAEGLALRIAEGDVPDVLEGVEIVALDMGLLQAGAGVKGEFENRLKDVIKEVKDSPTPIIVFIDEAHTLIGAGGSEGGSDAANLLKPALARGELRTIAATTWSEYKKYFEKDAALSRRFQLVKVDEPDTEGCVTMLRGLRERYEEAHGVIIRDDALMAAAELGSRYISGRQHPDKGIDLVDTSAARVRVALTAKPAEVEDAERHIQTLERELGTLMRDVESCAINASERIGELNEEIECGRHRLAGLLVEYEHEKKAADAVVEARKKLTALRKPPEKPEEAPGPESEDPEEAMRRKIEEEMRRKFEEQYGRTLTPADAGAETSDDVEDPAVVEARTALHAAIANLHEVQGREPLVNVEVTPEVVAKVVSDWTGVPLGKMVRDQAGALLALEDTLGTRIKGQRHVLECVGTRVRAAKAGLKAPNQPMGVFLFVGPSGVGKTETALGIADMLFGGEKFLTTINMSEFQEKHTVSRLIGSPPGYVGFGEGGVLTEAVRQKPYSVVLFDEVEKCHPEVMNLFYQIFDKGMLADGEGRVVDFKNTILFMTSNLASDKIMKYAGDGNQPEMDDLVSAIRPVLSDHFKPALLARMTVVPFYPISADVMTEIVSLKLGHLADRLLASHKMKLHLGDTVVQHIADQCTEAETGARNIDHLINAGLLPQISTRILQQMALGALPRTLAVDVVDDQFTYDFGEIPEA